MNVFLLMIPVALFGSIFAKEEYIFRHPESQCAVVNSTVTLQCRVKVLEKYDVHWVKDGFGLGNTREDIRQYGRPVNNRFRYDLPYNLAEGEYDLRITDLNLADEGVFYCQVVVHGLAFSSKRATVLVLVRFDSPQLFQITNKGRGPKESRSEIKPITVNDGDFVYLECLARNGRMAVNFSWFINDIELTPIRRGIINGTFLGDIQYSSESSKKYDGLFDVRSNLKLQIGSLRHGNLIKCVTQDMYLKDEKPKFSVAQIEVHITPQVTITSYPSKNGFVFTENDLVEFMCSAVGRPSNFHWKWFLNNKLLNNIADNKYKLQISRNHHKSSLKCAAISTLEGSKSITLKVKYGPKFLNPKPQMYPASLGDDVKMSCKADSNPAASISWQKESSQEVIGKGTDLIRKDVQDEDFGMYRCTAKSEDFTPVFKNFYLAKKRPPVVKHPAVSYGREGQSARLTCTIESVPLPKDEEIFWVFQNKRVVDDSRHKLYKEEMLSGVVTVLQITSLRMEDFNDYNCTVKTSSGYSTTSVMLIHQGSPTVIIVGGAIILAFILVITIFILCICRKTKSKDSYQKGNPSSPEIPVRHDPKATLIDSDCHCNPNLYNWTTHDDSRKQMHNKGENLWQNAKQNDIEELYKYSNSGSASQSSKKSIKADKHEFAEPKPMLYSLQGLLLDKPNFIQSDQQPTFSTLPLSGHHGADVRLYDPNQCQQYYYQDNYLPFSASLLDDNQLPPIYLMKQPSSNQKPKQFPTDYFMSSNPTPRNKRRKSDITDDKLVSDYASNI